MEILTLSKSHVHFQPMLTPVTTTGIVIADIMVNPKDFFSVVYTFDASLQNILLPGIRLGAVGAYVYVLLELGRRTFRYDVTGQVAMWCSVTLILGPVLAGTIVTLPRSWEALKDTGITGAIDLAWYLAKIIDPITGNVVNPLPQEIVDLAAIGKLPPADLVSAIQRLSQDMQVQYIWTLYNNFTEFSGGEAASREPNRAVPVGA